MLTGLLAAAVMATAAPLDTQLRKADCTAKPPRAGARFGGRVSLVIDGDSLCVETAEGLIQVRLVDFDAPEWNQPGGQAAFYGLREIALGRAVTCRAGHVSFHRSVAICRIDGVPIGDTMRRAGLKEGGN